MRRRDRRRTWGLWGDFVPLAERDLRIEVNERTLADGTIRKRVDPAEIRAAAKVLLDKGAQSVAVTFINAYANSENEQRALAESARGVAERIRHRLARGAVGNPRIRALLDGGDQRLSAAGGRGLSSASSTAR